MKSADHVFSFINRLCQSLPWLLGSRRAWMEQNTAPSVWMNVCGNQLHGRGPPHCRTSPRVWLGLGKTSTLKLCLTVKLFMNFFPLSDVQGSWCSVVTLPQRERGGHIRLTQRPGEYVQLHESGHMTDRFVTGFSYIMCFCRNSKGCA